MPKVFEAPPGFVLNPDYLVPELRAQRDVLLEVLQDLCDTLGECGMTEKARATIKAVEGEKT